MFIEMDQTGDGQVSKVEFAYILKKSDQEVPGDLEDILKSLDADGNGQIGYWFIGHSHLLWKRIDDAGIGSCFLCE